MHILVLQHAKEEHPGSFRKFLKEDGHTWDTVELDVGENLPLIDSFDALWVMGGPMDVWEEEKYPWLKKEKEFIKIAVAEKGLPYFGVCLGHQLLAESLGGKSKKPNLLKLVFWMFTRHRMARVGFFWMGYQTLFLLFNGTRLK